MGKVLGRVRTIRARTRHRCFLCSVAIEPSTIYLTWAWLEDRPTRISAHPDCHDYAHGRIDDWTNGDGCCEGAVETDLYETLVRHTYTPNGWSRVVGMDEAEAEKILTTWPGLAAQMERVRADIAESMPASDDTPNARDEREEVPHE